LVVNETQQLGVGSLESACDRNDVKKLLGEDVFETPVRD